MRKRWARMNMGCRRHADSEIPAALAIAEAEVKRLKGESRAGRAQLSLGGRSASPAPGPPNGKSMTATIALVDDDRNMAPD